MQPRPSPYQGDVNIRRWSTTAGGRYAMRRLKLQDSRGVDIEHCVVQARRDPERKLSALMHEPQK